MGVGVGEGGLLGGERGGGALCGLGGAAGRGGCAAVGVVAGGSVAVAGVAPAALWGGGGRCAVGAVWEGGVVWRASRTADWRCAAGRVVGLLPYSVFTWTS